MKYRHALAALGLATIFTAPAFAADIISEEPPSPAPIEDLPGVSAWAGPYVGITGGYTFSGRSNTGTGRVDTDGINAGAFAGIQGQSGMIVYGVEGDAGWSDSGGSNGATGVRTKYDGSVRARAGVAVSDRVLVYGTAGGAAARTRVYDVAGRDHDLSLGWTAGVGVDAKVSEKVFARGEYRYTDYGSESFDTGSGQQDVDLKDSKVVLGLGVKF